MEGVSLGGKRACCPCSSGLKLLREGFGKVGKAFITIIENIYLENTVSWKIAETKKEITFHISNRILC